MNVAGYRGRFAPSPTGPLHAGSLVAALASWLDARAHGGQWLVRIEDVDTPRCQPGAAPTLLRQLADCHLLPDGPVVYQSQRHTAYQTALNELRHNGWAYGCACTRKDLQAAQPATHQRHQELRYPGTCRQRQLQAPQARSWRVRTEFPKPILEQNSMKKWPSSMDGQSMTAIDFEKSIIHWHDRALGPQTQALAHTVGDFVLLRADGCWAYQLAVVVDDAAQGITHVVRGQDLCDNTPRQIWLQALLGLPTPQYLHTPLLLDERGEKLSKQHGAPAVDTTTPEAALAALHQAAAFLGLPHERHTGFTQAFEHWIGAWKDRIRSGENPNHRAPSS